MLVRLVTMNRKKSNSQDIKIKEPVTVLLFFASLITIYINPDLQDPFNVPKFWILCISGAWIAGYLINFNTNGKLSFRYITNNKFSVLIFSFTFSLLIAAILTDIKFISFFGASGRKIGFITYFFFSIYMFASFKFASFRFIHKTQIFVTIIATLLAVYGIMQRNGKDFISWNNPYNSIISTFGNPNFASAAMAMFAVICTGTVLNQNFSKLVKLWNLCLIPILIFLINSSNSRQGFIVYVLGFSIIFYVWLINKNKILGQLWFIGVLILSAGAVLGMLQKGPLQSLLYKPSVSIRGYYWRAGYEMLKSNIFTGVGVDRYGEYFKKYREVGYPLNYGFDITSTNAHSIPIQLFATAGIFTGLTYAMLITYIFYRGLLSIKKSNNDERIAITTVFAAWIAYQAQSIISIENIGIGIWGWLLGGLVVGISFKVSKRYENENKVNSPNQYNKFSIFQPVVSGFLALIFIIFSSFFYVSEKNVIETRRFFDQTKKVQDVNFYSFANSALKSKFTDPDYKLQIIEMLSLTDRSVFGFEQLNKLYIEDPKNLDYLRAMAILLEKQGELSKVITIRLQIAKNDPWNCDNYLRLGLIYKSLGKFSEMDIMLKKIEQIAPEHPITSTARLQLTT